MPKQIEYPLHSFDECLEIAIDIYNKKEIHKEDLAKAKNCSLSGQFQLLLSSGSKYNLFKQRKGVLSPSREIEEIILAYSEKDKEKTIQNCIEHNTFLESIYKNESNFNDLNYLEKKLIKEYSVDPKKAKTVSKVIQNNAKYLSQSKKSQEKNNFKPLLKAEEIAFPEKKQSNSRSEKFKFTTSSLNCEFSINCIKDIELAELILQKAKRDYSNPI